MPARPRRRAASRRSTRSRDRPVRGRSRTDSPVRRRCCSPPGTPAVVRVRPYHATQTTYDLTIDGLHTYYVIAGNVPVLVHNCGGDEPVLFGQARVGPNFSKGGAFNGRSIYDVAGDLRAGR